MELPLHIIVTTFECGEDWSNVPDLEEGAFPVLLAELNSAD